MFKKGGIQNQQSRWCLNFNIEYSMPIFNSKYYFTDLLPYKLALVCFVGRWKGENVATTEVSDILTMMDSIQDANVYGVTVPGMNL